MNKPNVSAATFANLSELEVSADQLADLFGVQKNTILHYAREAGMPRISRGRYSLYGCVQWYNEKLRNAIEGGGDISEERRKLIAAQRQRHEIECAKLRGELIDYEEVRTCFAELAVIFSTQLDALGPRIAPSLLNKGDTSAIVRAIQDEAKSIRRSTSTAVQAFASTYANL
jgi:phage terminase Nu1 subunit (DNA packaging protein)